MVDERKGKRRKKEQIYRKLTEKPRKEMDDGGKLDKG